MQPFAASPISFANSDNIIQLLQEFGFSMLWNLRLNAGWAKGDNPDCWNQGITSSCAPSPEHENDLYNYVFALVERYDGDGFEDMGFETPDDPSDDLRIPIQFYLMTGEIEFAGATPMPDGGFGDDALSHFWTDNMDNLLRTHRIVYRALRDADPSGFVKLVSSGGVFWDLYTDFPDWPEIEGPTVQARLNGNNNHNAQYTESFERLKRIMRSFGDDSDGIECDYIGWHPHMPWREIDQAFAFIHTYAGTNKPIYIDDMWCNFFLQARDDAPGNTLFHRGGKPMEGDFPNEMLSSYSEARRGIIFDQIAGARDWYHGRNSRTLVKAFVSAYGEGAERVSISGIADLTADRLSLGAYINIMGTAAENFVEKPGYYTYGLMLEKLHDFSSVEELSVSTNPLTRVYKFTRPKRGPVYVMWSETGDAPPGLDYSIPTGETVSVPVESDTLILTHVISEPDRSDAEVDMITAENGTLTIQLGYSPYFIEPATTTSADEDTRHFAGITEYSNHPNPFHNATTIQFKLSHSGMVTVSVHDIIGNTIEVLLNRVLEQGVHRIPFRADNLATGVYFYQIRTQRETVVRPIVSRR